MKKEFLQEEYAKPNCSVGLGKLIKNNYLNAFSYECELYTYILSFIRVYYDVVQFAWSKGFIEANGGIFYNNFILYIPMEEDITSTTAYREINYCSVVYEQLVYQCNRSKKVIKLLEELNGAVNGRCELTNKGIYYRQLVDIPLRVDKNVHQEFVEKLFDDIGADENKIKEIILKWRSL